MSLSDSLKRAPVEMTVADITTALTTGFTTVDSALTTGMLRTATEVQIVDASGNIISGAKLKFIVNPSFRTTGNPGKSQRSRKPKATAETPTPSPAELADATPSGTGESISTAA